MNVQVRSERKVRRVVRRPSDSKARKSEYLRRDFTIWAAESLYASGKMFEMRLTLHKDSAKLVFL
jgi:hypothetical protein